MEGGITKRLHKITWGKKEGEHKKVVTGYNVKCEKIKKSQASGEGGVR